MKRICSTISLRSTSIILCSCVLFIQCSQQPKPGSEEYIRQATLKIDDDYLANTDQHPENWVTYGRNYAENRFSSLSEINKTNVSQLSLVWSLDLGTKHGIEATPLVVDGIMFLTSNWSVVHAIDARTGKMIWTYDPKVPRTTLEKACCDVVNRGVAMYKGNIYAGTLDGRLIALDAATGGLKWEVHTTDSTSYHSITGAPRVIKGNILIGNGGAEFGVRGFITAYDALTGQQKWRFYTVPGDPSQPFESEALKIAANTWSGEWWKYGGGGTAWDAIVFDPQLNLLYVGTGNGSPWNRFYRSDGKGDNLFLSSILAINPDNGELAWYYQTTPGEQWDYTATQPIILADIELKGQQRKVLMQAPKNGFFYMLDRTNGELISARNYTYVNWATGIDPESGRPIETSFSRYEFENVQLSPGPNGGHNWHPMAYNPQTKLAYIPVQLNSFVYGNDKNWKPMNKAKNIGSFAAAHNPTRLDSAAPGNMDQGILLAWDPVKQQEVWKIENKAFSVNSGVLTTGGELVFQGTADGKMYAYDASNGNKLWEYNLGAGVVAPPITYTIDDRQYISIAVGWGGGIPSLWMKATDQIYPGTIFTFAISNDTSRSYAGFKKEQPSRLIDIDVSASSNEVDAGKQLYVTYCQSCHGFVGLNGGSIPNLAYSSEATFNLMKSIVLERAFAEKGMPDFSDRLSPADVSLIKNYILYTVKNLKR